MSHDAIQTTPPRRPAQQLLAHRAQGVLMQGERLLAVAACTDFHRLYFLPPSGVVVTDHRVLLLKLGLFGGLQFDDFHWEHAQDIHLGIHLFGATLQVTASASKSGMQSHAMASGTRVLKMAALAKEEAQAVYRIGQEMEQSWRDRQRGRYIEEQRLRYGGPAYIHSVASVESSGASEPASPDVASRVRQLKSLLEQDLITQSEFEERKASILASI